MKEFLKSNVQSLKELDWPESTLYEVVNNIDLDQSVISLIHLKFYYWGMHSIRHCIYRNRKLESETNLRNFKGCAYKSYRNCFKDAKINNRKTLKEICKMTGGANKNVRII